MNPIGVMQLTDTLALGGLERVAVNLANSFPREQFRSHLCATRDEGPLRDIIEPHVRLCLLHRTGRIDLKAIFRLVAYIRRHRILIVHAHGTSVFVAAAASMFLPGLKLVWHDHFGRFATEERPVRIYRVMARRLSGVIAVNPTLAAWSQTQLGMPADRVWYVPNFVCLPRVAGVAQDLPGRPDYRIVCVANLRPEKDHPTLLKAMKQVVAIQPEAHLILVGGQGNSEYLAQVKAMIAQETLQAHVSWLGARRDVASILAGCAVGVLSSASEGLPLALIEYGMAGLPAVATNAGQCAEVLGNGRAGRLVARRAAPELAQAILSLLENPTERAVIAARFSRRVRRYYSARSIIKRICQIYEVVLGGATGTKRT